MNNKTKTIISAVVLFLTAALIASAVIFLPDKSGSGSGNGEENGSVFSMEHGIEVLNFGGYAGAFVEDGSNEPVENVTAITLENRGDDYIQLMRFAVTTDNGDRYVFELTTLFPGEKMTVMETDKKAFTGGDFATAEIIAYTPFAAEPSMCEDVFAVETGDGTITVKNISEETVSAGRVFYKNYVNGTYIGGITYMSSFENLEPGASSSLYAAHFSGENSRAVFVTYAEQQ